MAGLLVTEELIRRATRDPPRRCETADSSCPAASPRNDRAGDEAPRNDEFSRGIVAGAVSEAPERSAVTVSSSDLLRAARVVRGLQGALEASLWVVVAGSVLAFGAVHAWAYSILWVGCFLAAAIALARAVAVGGLRQRLGAHHVAFHVSGRWLVVEPHPADRALGWSIDLARAGAPPRAASPPRPRLSRARAPAARAARGRARDARARGDAPRDHVRARLPAAAPGGGRGLRPPRRPAALPDDAGLARRRARPRRARAARERHAARLRLLRVARGRAPLRPVREPQPLRGLHAARPPDRARAARRTPGAPTRGAWATARTPAASLVGLQTREGTRLVYAALPPLLGIGALLASTSRGGILAFFAALAIAAVGVRARKGTPAWAAALVFAAVALTWFGLERLEVRFLRALGRRAGADGRVARVARRRCTARAGPRATASTPTPRRSRACRRGRCPRGATPWPEAVAVPLASGERLGYRAPSDLPGLAWYREAHSDWVQLLVETGVPGLLVGLWAALAALAAARRDPWLFAALAGVLMHVFVDFDLQIPAIPALFVVLAALPRRQRGRVSRPQRDPNRATRDRRSRRIPRDPSRPESLGMTGGLLCFRVGFRLAATPFDTHRRTRCASHPSVPSSPSSPSPRPRSPSPPPTRGRARSRPPSC